MRRFAVAQLGARLRYGAARALYKRGALARLYTDICASPFLRSISGVLPPPFRRVAERVVNGIPAETVRSFPWFGLRYALARASASAGEQMLETYLRAGEWFARRVALEEQRTANCVYAFNSAALELLKMTRSSGRMGVLEQTIAPFAVEQEILAGERERFPLWERPRETSEAGRLFAARELEEWICADIILCASDFVRQGIAKCGGPAGKCRVVPYGVDTAAAPSPAAPPPHSGPLRVITVGAVSMRKGSPYVLESARRLRGRAQFRMVGSIEVSTAAVAELASCVELLAPVPHSLIAEQYRWADVLFLPSLCEGSAAVTYEALRAGLPVVCTPNTGSVVTDGVDGFVVPARDVDAMVERLGRLADRADLLRDLSVAAARTATALSLDHYAAQLAAILDLGN